MTFDFGNLFKGNTIKINGYVCKIGGDNSGAAIFKSNEIEDDEFFVQFLNDGSIRITTKLYPGDPQRTYIKNNAFMDEHFGKLMRPYQTKIDNGMGFSAVVNQSSVITDENGKKMKHSVYIENIFYVYDDGFCENEGIFFYIVDTPVKQSSKKKK